MNLSTVFQFCSIAISLISISLKTTASVAQVSGDQTFRDGENTVITPVGGVYTITGGASRGNNLFHSFEQFSLSQEEQAFFAHDSNIETILGRVTGSSVSNIDGIISVDTTTSTADIFLINPQGIIFGSNATLDIGGSFIASTAGKIVFADGSQFSAVSSQPVSLTVSQPVGLVLGNSSGNIVYESVSDDPELESLGGLRVIAGESIVLGSRIE